MQGYYNWGWMQDYIEFDLPPMFLQMLILMNSEGNKNNMWWDEIWKPLQPELQDLKGELFGPYQDFNSQIIQALKNFKESTYPPVQPKSYGDSLVQNYITETLIAQWENEVDQFQKLLDAALKSIPKSRKRNDPAS